MGKKDIEEKLLEDYNDVFADIVNVNLFGGRQVVAKNELENTKDKSRFKNIDGILTEQERDVAKWWKKYGIRIVLVGFENQTRIDPQMCFRLYGYDGAAYKSQYGCRKNYPVITLVLYFGTKRWDKAKSLSDSLDIPEELRPFFNDYRMNLIEIAWQTDEQLAMYKSDFRIVADYFIQKRKRKGLYTPGREKIRHVDSVLKMMSALTGDDRFEKIVNERRKGERKVKNMCEVLDRVEKRGIEKGMKEGEQLFAGLIKRLVSLGKKDDIEKVVEDSAYRERLYKKYGLKPTI